MLSIHFLIPVGDVIIYCGNRDMIPLFCIFRPKLNKNKPVLLLVLHLTFSSWDAYFYISSFSFFLMEGAALLCFLLHFHNLSAFTSRLEVHMYRAAAAAAEVGVYLDRCTWRCRFSSLQKNIIKMHKSHLSPPPPPRVSQRRRSEFSQK